MGQGGVPKGLHYSGFRSAVCEALILGGGCAVAGPGGEAREHAEHDAEKLQYTASSPVK